MMLPLSLGAIADAVNATHRLGPMFRGETVSTKMKEDMIDGEEGDKAVIVENASFTWDAPPPNTSNTKVKKGSPAPVKTTEAPATPADPFKLPPLSLSVKKGSLVAIVGPVGCGKTSLLQGLIGEMRKTEGKVSFCGSVAYCPQSAWIQVSSIYEKQADKALTMIYRTQRFERISALDGSLTKRSTGKRLKMLVWVWTWRCGSTAI